MVLIRHLKTDRARSHRRPQACWSSLAHLQTTQREVPSLDYSVPRNCSRKIISLCQNLQVSDNLQPKPGIPVWPNWDISRVLIYPWGGLANSWIGNIVQLDACSGMLEDGELFTIALDNWDLTVGGLAKMGRRNGAGNKRQPGEKRGSDEDKRQHSGRPFLRYKMHSEAWGCQMYPREERDNW